MQSMSLTPWFLRRFNQVSNDIFLVLLERLSGTPIRIREKLKGIPISTLQSKPGDRWSILENIGHVADLEPLWIGRIADIRNGQRYMRSADLSNQKTQIANHNNRGVDDIIQDFAAQRQILITALKELDQKDLEKRAHHPRLETPMAIVDLMWFVAEHDDHHLATCSLLLEKV